MIDHSKPLAHVLDRVRFTYDGREFSGRGLFTWDPDKGIHLQAFLDQHIPQANAFAEVGQVEVTDLSDTRSIRVQGSAFGHALVPHVFPNSLRKFLHEGRLSIHPERILFFQRYPVLATVPQQQECWSGSADFLVKREPEFPDNLNTETTLNGHTVQSSSRGGLCIEEEDGFSVWGRITDTGTFALSWALPRDAASKTDAWQWAEGARRALSVLFAQTIWPVKVSIKRGITEITELRAKKEVHRLSRIHRPFTDFGPPDQWKFNRTAFVRLTRFFATKSKNAETCWSIFRRLAEASRQETWESRELLTATTLEAALRTLDNHPFKPKDHSWDPNQSLESFRSSYLDPTWEATCKRVLEVRKRLRHRNAHPDWITHPGGSFSKREWRKSIEDLTFLSRFYGYMILALAGFNSLEPRFPTLPFKSH